MTKAIKTITVEWEWEGDETALEGFNVALTPSGDNPTNVSNLIKLDKSSPYSYKHTLRNVSIDINEEIDVWVQALIEGKDSDWLNQGGLKINDQDGATIVNEDVLEETFKKTIPKQENSPDNPQGGDLWLDITDKDNIILKRYDGTVWQDISSELSSSFDINNNVFQSRENPENYSNNLRDKDLWIDTSTEKPNIKQRDSGLWVDLSISSFNVNTRANITHLGESAYWYNIGDIDGNKPQDNADVTKRAETVTIAAYNSTKKGKEGADYVCTGSGDEQKINEAIENIGFNAGSIVLLEGDYEIDYPIKLFSNITFKGVSKSTNITTSDSFGNNDLVEERRIFTYLDSHGASLVYQDHSEDSSTIRTYDGISYFSGDIIKYELDNGNTEYNKVMSVKELYPDYDEGDWAELELKNNLQGSVSLSNEITNVTIMKNISIKNLSLKNIFQSTNLFYIKGGMNCNIENINLFNIGDIDGIGTFNGESIPLNGFNYSTDNVEIKDLNAEDLGSVVSFFQNNDKCSNIALKNIKIKNVSYREQTLDFVDVKGKLKLENITFNNVHSTSPGTRYGIFKIGDCNNVIMKDINLIKSQTFGIENCSNLVIDNFNISEQGRLRISNFTGQSENISINNIRVDDITTGTFDKNPIIIEDTSNLEMSNIVLYNRSQLELNNVDYLNLNNIKVKNQSSFIPIVIENVINLVVKNCKFNNWEEQSGFYIKLEDGYCKFENNDFIIDDQDNENFKVCISIFGVSNSNKKEFIIKNNDFKIKNSPNTVNIGIRIEKENSDSISVCAHNELLGDGWNSNPIKTIKTDGTEIVADEILGGNLIV